MSDWTRRLFAVAMASLLAACGGDDGDPHLPVSKIVQAAQADARFSVPVEAVMAAALTGALSAPGPLPVFAPTNDTFAALLTELNVTKEARLADVPLLTKVLTYPAVNGRVPKADGPVGPATTTLQTGTFTFDSTLWPSPTRACARPASPPLTCSPAMA